MTGEHDTPALACIIGAIPTEQRPLHRANIEQIIASAREARDLATGYAWSLPNDMDLLQTLVAFISYERLCCPFFRFTIDVEPDQGPIWFSITGPTGVKEFLQSAGLVPSHADPA